MSRKEGNYEMYTRKQPTGFVEYPLLKGKVRIIDEIEQEGLF